MPAARRDLPPARHLTGTLYILALLAIAIFCYERSLAFFLLSLAAAGTAWKVIESPRHPTTPRWLINLALVAAAVYLALEIRTSYINESVVIALDRFVASRAAVQTF